DAFHYFQGDSLRLDGGAGEDSLYIQPLAPAATLFTLAGDPHGGGYWRPELSLAGVPYTLDVQGIETFFFGRGDGTIAISGSYTNAVSHIDLFLGAGSNVVSVYSLSAAIRVFDNQDPASRHGSNDTITVTGGDSAFVSAFSGDDVIDTGEGGAGATD